MSVAQGIVKSLHQSPLRLVTTFNWNYIIRFKIQQQCKRCWREGLFVVVQDEGWCGMEGDIGFSGPRDGRRGKGSAGSIFLDGLVWVLTQKRSDGQNDC